MNPSPVRKARLEVSPYDRAEKKDSWVSSASDKKLRLCAAGAGALAFGGAMLADRAISGKDRPKSIPKSLSHAAIGFLAGWAVMKSLEQARERRTVVNDRLKMIGDLNHHVRNALQSIQLSAYSTQDQEAISHITESVARIERALREIAPVR